VSYYFKDVAYVPVPPQADKEEWARDYARLVFQHRIGAEQPLLFVAERGEMVAGWVIGLIKQGGTRTRTGFPAWMEERAQRDEG
jgi:hypothetical protein